MISIKNLKIILFLLISSTLLISCGGKLPGADARKYDPDPKKRIAKNIEEGRSFRLMDTESNGGVVSLSLLVPMSYGDLH